jgi:putative membrane protein
MREFFVGVLYFSAYFAGAVAFFIAFSVIYLRLTPHREFDMVVREHNASAAVALGGTLIGFAIALSGAIHNTHSAIEFVAWGLVAALAQVVAYGLARLVHPGLSHAIEKNALAAALWQAAVSIAAGLVSAACMSP